MLLQRADQSCRAKDLKFYSGIFEQFRAGKYILFRGDYSNRKGIPALPFSKTAVTIAKPFKINENGLVKTVGDHIKLKRLQLGLFQKDVANIIGVSEDSITFWERNRTIPYIRYMPRIIAFLGYNPISVDHSALDGKLFEFRILRGLSYKAMAKLIGVDATTLASWENNQTSPPKQKRIKLIRILSGKF